MFHSKTRRAVQALQLSLAVSVGVAAPFLAGPTLADSITLTDGSGTAPNGRVGMQNGVLSSSGTGDVSAASNVTVGKNLTVSGQTTVNNFAVTNGSTVSMGDNRVQDVATPVAPTDATNKAYVDRGLSKANEGTAIALAISQPVFLPGQDFAVRAGWGGYEDQNAFGFSMAGVIAHDVFGSGSTVSLDGGFGVGGNYNTVAGKAGVTIGFGNGYTSLK